ncbi:adenosylcobinamide kinase/adenosylcobinamide-phosphate guanylyltransferase [Pedobacter cryoconitis]|uniref:Adenosylcobinamide kinase n=1 Tax=Pedobacter cryoconitis TaxID=188932 RepID=A0A7W8ZPP8_9SPHI|nr:bifunctional adenosylcobinamide kinase/adenosylcobinamide-phosphate guanylyltransferase [Pedobacter cryoconitis]MBB5637894.1 adenosylcobinamide kinase/adenosylcobinamide-phosphate guanylyltransferase [Pedobacter cryoconitis]MBB6270349.1 adenosylcobinamide kinase/adenosylcobinamide-phosphate guanylyltransferase [Pedobacter cryoconitis]
MLIFITGGVRSGKSGYAQQRAKELCNDPVYVATAKIWDEDFKERVIRHQHDRGAEWTNFEAYRHLHLLPIQGRYVVIDCVTLWLTNLFMDRDNDIELALADFKEEIDQLIKIPGTFIIISNELGMGLHADTPVGRKFVDLQGWANQYTASKADEAIFMVSGLPLFLKK